MARRILSGASADDALVRCQLTGPPSRVWKLPVAGLAAMNRRLRKSATEAINLVAFSEHLSSLEGQIFVVFIITMIGLAVRAIKRPAAGAAAPALPAPWT